MDFAGDVIVLLCVCILLEFVCVCVWQHPFLMSVPLRVPSLCGPGESHFSIFES